MEQKSIEQIKIDCTFLEINEILFKIVYLFEKEKDVILFFDLKVINFPVSNKLSKLKKILFKIILERKRKVYVQGIPKEIFYTTLLPFSSWWKFKDFIFLIEKELPQIYIDKFGNEELNKYKLNLEKKEIYKNFSKNFKNQYIILKYADVLNYFLNDNFVKRIELVFVNSFPKDTLDSSRERFVCYIYNNLENFDIDFNLFKKIFPKNLLVSLKKYLFNSHQYVLSISLMENEKIRKTLYINTLNLREEFRINLLRDFKININFDLKDLWGIGFDLIDDEIVSFKTYCVKQNVVEEEFKEYLKDFQISQKVNFLYLIRNLKNPLFGVLFDEKIKSGKVISKRIDISLQFNDFLIEEVKKINYFKNFFFEKKDLYTISFEFSKDNKEKINIYYSL